MKTERLFYRDTYLKEFTARVESCLPAEKNEKEEQLYKVVLDRTAFYPEGGGQPADQGSLNGFAVLDVQEEGEDLVHLVAGRLEPGTQVQGRIDWERRFDLMQQHSGEHLVSGMIHKHYGYENVGFHLGAELVTIDLSGPLTPEQLTGIEEEVNRYIWENHETRILYPDEEELKTLPFRSKKELTGEVRLVDFPGGDLCACCGLHVRATGEIGLVKLLSAKKFHEGVRIEMVSGRRAMDLLNVHFRENSRVGVALSVKAGDTSEAVDRLLEENYHLKGQVIGNQQKLYAMISQTCRDRGNVLVITDGMAAADIRKCADSILDTCGGKAVLLSGNDREGYRYAAGERDGNVKELTARINRDLQGRGGGKPFFTQGSLKASLDVILTFFEKEGFAKIMLNS